MTLAGALADWCTEYRRRTKVDARTIKWQLYACLCKLAGHVPGQLGAAPPETHSFDESGSTVSLDLQTELPPAHIAEAEAEAGEEDSCAAAQPDQGSAARIAGLEKENKSLKQENKRLQDALSRGASGRARKKQRTARGDGLEEGKEEEGEGDDHGGEQERATKRCRSARAQSGAAASGRAGAGGRQTRAARARAVAPAAHVVDLTHTDDEDT